METPTYRVVKGTGLLSGRADQETALSSVIDAAESHNTVPQRYQEAYGKPFPAKWDTWTVEGRWWVYEDQTPGQKGLLQFMPARPAKDGRAGVRPIGTITIEKVGGA